MPETSVECRVTAILILEPGFYEAKAPLRFSLQRIVMLIIQLSGLVKSDAF